MSDSFNSVDYKPPGSSVYGILQVRILEWVAISFSRGSSRPRDQTHIKLASLMSHALAGRFFTNMQIAAGKQKTSLFLLLPGTLRGKGMQKLPGDKIMP